MRYAASYDERRAAMTSSGPDDRAQALRDSAASLLQEAAQSSDLARRDALTRKALAQIEEARRLLDAAGDPAPQPAKRLH